MASEPEVAFRIVVERPPSGVSFGVQLGKTEQEPGKTKLLRPSRAGEDSTSTCACAEGAPGAVVFLGEAARGHRVRFIYVNSGHGGTVANTVDAARKARLGRRGAVGRALARPRRQFEPHHRHGSRRRRRGTALLGGAGIVETA